MKAKTIFFCYAWEETDERYRVLDYIRRRLIRQSHDPVKIILDKHTYQFNSDFEELRQRIRSYDLVVVFCTPDLKDIISDPDSKKNKDREVLKEYKIIKERFDNDSDSVFPIILEGTKENALLDLFSSVITQQFEYYNLSKDEKTNKYHIARDKETEFRSLLIRILELAICNAENKSEEYKTVSEALSKLFGLTDNSNIPNSCLVKQPIYEQIRDQTCCFIVGRKGSGKSTFITKYRNMDQQYFDSHYKKLLPIKIADFQQENAYDSLIVRHKADSKTVEPHDLLCLFWQVYFVLHVICSIGREIEDGKITIKDNRYRIFKSVGSKLKKITGIGEQVSFKSQKVAKAIFAAAVEMIDNQFYYSVDRLREGELVNTSFASRFTLTDVLEANFGGKTAKSFITALSKCERKVLIALDGFDTHSDDFSKVTNRIASKEEQSSRKGFEVLFYRTLIEVVTQFKSRDTRDDYADVIAEVTQYCIILPKDKYDFVVDDDRDIFKKSFCAMSWTAYELMQLLIKRLDYLIHMINPNADFHSDDPLIPIEEQMNKALSFFPGVPTTMSMDVDKNKVEMSLFNYILRNSFWRPRDIISNLNYILAKATTLSDLGAWGIKKVNLSDENIKKTVRDNCAKIIADEFVGEYKHVFRNLNEVLDKLTRQNEQINVIEFKNTLKGIPFDADFSYDLSLSDNKLKVLYQLGVIGLLFKKEFAKQQHYNTHICFEFNEGLGPLDDYLELQNDPATQDTSVIFNPIFTKRLLLGYNSKELIGNWDSEYYESNRINKDTLHRL